MIHRIGTFFILVGLGLFILFLGAALSHDAYAGFLLFSLVTLFLGFLFRRKAPRPAPSGRFGVVHRTRENSRKRKEEQEKKKAARKK